MFSPPCRVYICRQVVIAQSVCYGRVPLLTIMVLMQLKKVLSSIPEAPLNVECLMNDIDFRSSMTREQFEELAKPVLERARAPLEKVCLHV